MEWNNLKKVECPQCATHLSETSMGYKCDNCEFFIGFEKFQAVVNRLFKPQTKYDANTEERNRAWLNEL